LTGPTLPRHSARQATAEGAVQGEKKTLGVMLTPAAAIAAALAVLMLPALWNGYPLLQYDTGGYLARWYEGYLVPSRSTVFGLYLHFGEGLHFWPIVVFQTLLTIWILALTLRVHDVARSWRIWLAIAAVLCVATALPWLTSMLLTDVFAGLSVLALHLLLFESGELRLFEKFGLMLTVAFAAASHSATLAMLLAITAAAAVAWIFVRALTSARALLTGFGAIALGAAMLLTANFALSGKLTWTPGGYGIAFGRMLQDGIVTRFLNENCVDAKYKLCPYRNELPTNADDFLWSDGVFNRLGRFNGLGDEMREIVLRSLAAYPGEQLRTAVVATGQQFAMVASGHGVHDRLWHTYGIMERFIRGEVPAMRAARQQRGELDFDWLNRLHVPVAFASMALMLAALARFRRGPRDDLALLAASVSVAVLANAFLCGALSGPHDRYGARLSWVMTFVVAIVAARTFARVKVTLTPRHGTVPAAP
jgi:hypothetical protein